MFHFRKKVRDVLIKDKKNDTTSLKGILTNTRSKLIVKMIPELNTQNKQNHKFKRKRKEGQNNSGTSQPYLRRSEKFLERFAISKSYGVISRALKPTDRISDE